MISIANLSLRIGSRTLLDRVSLSIGNGETVALIGESGSGKTSLARLLLGLRPANGKDMSWDGDVRIDRYALNRMTGPQWRPYRGRTISLLSQSLADALNPQITVEQDLRESLALHTGRKLTTLELCQRHNIPVDLLHRYPARLSGGEIRRVMSALALAGDPPNLVLDEPTSALDFANQDAAVQLIATAKANRATLLITHDIALAHKLADRIVQLDGGRFNAVQNTSDVASVLLRRLAMPHGSTMPALEVTGLSHTFGERPILQDVSLKVGRSECTAIVGASSAGKTTPGWLISGFEPLQRGEIIAGGRIAFISQHPHRALPPHFSVRQVLAEAKRFCGEHDDPLAIEDILE